MTTSNRRGYLRSRGTRHNNVMDAGWSFQARNRAGLRVKKSEKVRPKFEQWRHEAAPRGPGYAVGGGELRVPLFELAQPTPEPDASAGGKPVVPSEAEGVYPVWPRAGGIRGD